MTLKAVFFISASAISLASVSQAEVRDHRKGYPQGGVSVTCTTYNVNGGCVPRRCFSGKPFASPGGTCTVNKGDHR